MNELELAIGSAGSLGLSVGASEGLSLGIGSGGSPTIWYTGPYEATPSREEQVFPTHGRTMRDDFVVHPIPSNYGLVTWNGSVLTVS